MKDISYSSSIAGNWTTPAPPPENAEKMFEISETIKSERSSTNLVPSNHSSNTLVRE